MIYILIGEEDFLIKEKIESLDIDGDILVFSAKEKDLEDKLNKSINQRLFGKDEWIIIKDCDKSSLNNKILNILLKNKNIILIFNQKPDYLIKDLEKNKIQFQIEEIPSLSFKKPEEFEAFLKEFIKNYNIKIPDYMLKNLSKIFLNSPNALLNELKKIKYYKEGKPITKEELIQLIKWPTDSQIFELLDDLVNKNYEDFIMRIKREILIGTKIENIIAYLYKTLLRILLIKKIKYKQSNILNSLNIKPAYQWRLKEYGKNLDEAEIRKMIQILADLDRKYKKFILKEEDFAYELFKALS